MEIKQRKSVNDKLKTYDYMAKETDYIEVTEWSNGEGYDVSINDTVISLTHGQIAAINHLIGVLNYAEI